MTRRYSGYTIIVILLLLALYPVISLDIQNEHVNKENTSIEQSDFSEIKYREIPKLDAETFHEITLVCLTNTEADLWIAEPTCLSFPLFPSSPEIFEIAYGNNGPDDVDADIRIIVYLDGKPLKYSKITHLEAGAEDSIICSFIWKKPYIHRITAELVIPKGLSDPNQNNHLQSLTFVPFIETGLPAPSWRQVYIFPT